MTGTRPTSADVDEYVQTLKERDWAESLERVGNSQSDSAPNQHYKIQIKLK